MKNTEAKCKKETSDRTGSEVSSVDVSSYCGGDIILQSAAGVATAGANLAEPQFAPHGRKVFTEGESQSPPSNTGVTEVDEGYTCPVSEGWRDIPPKKKGEITVGLHWIGLTLFCGRNEAVSIYGKLLYDDFGELEVLGHGIKGYRSCLVGKDGFKLAYEPSREDGKDYCSYVIPGEACEGLRSTFLSEMYRECEERGVRIHCTRLDYKFDYCGFSPMQLYWAVKKKLIRGAFRVEKVTVITDGSYDETGKVGMNTVYLGSASSVRRMCCYDAHGFTRVEMRNRDEVAEAIVSVIMERGVGKWGKILRAQLGDFIEIDYRPWAEFMMGVERAKMKIRNRENVEIEKMWKYFITQCSALASVLYDTDKARFLWAIEEGRGKREKSGKYGLILHAYGLKEE